MERKIIKFDAETAQVVIQWGDYAPHTIDLPIGEDGSLPTGDDFDRWVNGFAPVYAEERKAQIAKGITNADQIAALVTPLPEPKPTWESIRYMRAQFLASTDWTQLEDAPISAEKKEAYKVYRQALRDIPETFSTPESVVFPDLPR